jgi:iron-sulfur cluster insertion protein
MPDATNTTYPSAVADRDVRLTPAAGSKMAELLRDIDEEIQGIRVFVTGGGCSGMTYGITYADATSGYDSTLEGDGYRILIDAVALNFLQGCEIDFNQESFVFKNVFQAVGGSGACGGCAGGGF